MISGPPQTQPPSFWRTAALNLAVLAVALTLTLGLCELGVRILYARSLDFSMEMWKYAVALKRPVANPKLSFVHAADGSAFLMGVEVTTNSHGYRDGEYSPTPGPGTYRILMLGDSTTFGWGVAQDQTIAKQLERALNSSPSAQGRRFEVLNAGVGNYGTVQEVEHYRVMGRNYHPHLVILQYFINDPEPVPRENRSWLASHSYLLAFSISRFDGLLRLTGSRPQWQSYYTGLYTDRNRAGLAAAEQALGDLAQFTAEDHASLLVTLLPELRSINGEYPFAEQHRIVQAALARYGIRSMELIEGLHGHGPESELWVTLADSHPNARANALVTAQLLPWVEREATALK